jgi:hypothetical protein
MFNSVWITSIQIIFNYFAIWLIIVIFIPITVMGDILWVLHDSLYVSVCLCIQGKSELYYTIEPFFIDMSNQTWDINIWGLFR